MTTNQLFGFCLGGWSRQLLAIPIQRQAPTFDEPNGQWQPRYLVLDFTPEHQPVRRAPIGVLADESGQVHRERRPTQTHFLVGFPAGADIGRFAYFTPQLSAAGAPK